ncbi:MAG: dodecin domain-containing protein [Actinomycetota bacterium]|nr:dodecin domain-containing protein [Actinomycetota bacterium]
MAEQVSTDRGSRTDADRVDQVIRLVGHHPESWEAATSGAVAEAAKSIPDLEWAGVERLDTIRAETGLEYRVQLRLSYRLDRRRETAGSHERTEVRRYLVVANRTVGGPELTEALEARMQRGPTEFHVVVPATWSQQATAIHRLGVLAADPTSGLAIPETALIESIAAGRRSAEKRLVHQLERLAKAGVVGTGEVGDPDPLNAVGAVLDRASFDEIIVSTLPAGISRWLGMDLPSRLERRTGLPVVVIEATDEPPDGA